MLANGFTKGFGPKGLGKLPGFGVWLLREIGLGHEVWLLKETGPRLDTLTTWPLTVFNNLASHG